VTKWRIFEIIERDDGLELRRHVPQPKTDRVLGGVAVLLLVAASASGAIAAVSMSGAAIVYALSVTFCAIGGVMYLGERTTQGIERLPKESVRIDRVEADDYRAGGGSFVVRVDGEVAATPLGICVFRSRSRNQAEVYNVCIAMGDSYARLWAFDRDEACSLAAALARVLGRASYPTDAEEPATPGLGWKMLAAFGGIFAPLATEVGLIAIVPAAERSGAGGSVLPAVACTTGAVVGLVAIVGLLQVVFLSRWRAQSREHARR
jgi:hypothetical protein